MSKCIEKIYSVSAVIGNGVCYAECAEQGAYMPNVNLFTNGILLGNAAWCDAWLPEWKRLGLTNIAVSVHSVNRWKQAIAYGLVPLTITPYGSGYSGPWLNPETGETDYKYPVFEDIFANIRKHGIGVRTTLLLRRGRG